MSYDNDDGDHQPKRLIYHTRERVQAALNKYYRELASSGGCSNQTKVELASAALQYHSVLNEHRDENTLSPKWEKRGVDWLETAITDTVTVNKTVDRLGGGTTTEQVPRIHTVSTQKIISTIHELNSIAKELGFSAQTRNRRADPSEARV